MKLYFVYLCFTTWFDSFDVLYISYIKESEIQLLLRVQFVKDRVARCLAAVCDGGEYRIRTDDPLLAKQVL